MDANYATVWAAMTNNKNKAKAIHNHRIVKNKDLVRVLAQK